MTPPPRARWAWLPTLFLPFGLFRLALARFVVLSCVWFLSLVVLCPAVFLLSSSPCALLHLIAVPVPSVGSARCVRLCVSAMSVLVGVEHSISI